MKNRIIVICVSILLCACAMAVNTQRDKELLKDYHGKVQLPDDLYNVYAAFIKAINTADFGDIRQQCLSNSVSFTKDARPEKMREYGPDINIPFLKNGFHKYILYLRKDSKDTYLIRTVSTYMWFVRTKSEGWKLYRYGDKPIE